MAFTDNPYIGLPLEQQQQLQQLGVQALSDVLKVGRSTAFPGLTVTRADMSEITQMLKDLRGAIAFTTGTGGKQMAQATVNTQSRFSVAVLPFQTP